MSKKIKYIVIDDINPVLLADSMQHADFENFNVTSAGFCNINYNNKTYEYEVNCFGKSVSLNMETNDYDNTLIERMLNG